MSDGSLKSSGNTLPIVKFGAKYIAYSHTLFAYCAFLIALAVGCYTHYYKIVQNEYFGYPEEWFPSVSATTGDRYPARAIFQIFIALTSGPRFALVFLWYFYSTISAKTTSKRFGLFLLAVGVIRTVSCGGWVYITSTDDHLTHDVAMILYLLCTLPWQLGVLYSTSNKTAVKWRRFFTIAFFTTLPPMIYYFIQHKVNRIPGAYTTYAFFEWSLILYDVAYDAVTAIEFQNFEFSIIDKAALPPAVNKSSVPFVANPQDNISPYALRSLTILKGFATETYLAFVFWSMLTSLTLLIWYFPLWYMGISGFEAFLFITLMPVVLTIGPLRRLIAKYRGVFHLLSLVGIASYLKLNPVWRLSMTAIGLGISLTTWVATWIESKKQTGDLERSALIWVLGLILHNIVKMAWFTENPIWPIMHKGNGGLNDVGIVLGIIASLEVCLRDASTSKAKSTEQKSPNTPEVVAGNSFMSAVGFGALLFAFHSMFTDSSTIMRWTVNGYPNYGPEPVPWGVATIGALAFGLLISPYRRLTTSLGWYVVGCAACAGFYFTSAWKGFFSGLVLCTYFVSITPAFIRALSTTAPFITLFTSFMVYNILCLAHVWVVAYEFVPGGVYAREHTDYILLTMMIFTGLGVLNSNKQFEADTKSKIAQFHIFKHARGMTRLFIVCFMTLSTLVSFNRVANAKTPVPYTTSEKSFTAGIWTIHFALDNDMWASEQRMRDAIRDLELDVVGLLESDTMRIIMGNRDWAQSIAEELGYYVDYGPSSMKHTWGCLMLSKFPIIKSEHHLLPSPVGELACAIHATLDVYGQPVDFIVSHNGQDENYEDRIQQTTELARIMRTSPNPFVFLGYVVTKPYQEIYHKLFDGGDMNDIDPSDWDRWCEYVGYRGLRRVGYARVSHGGITDTEIQTGKFQVVDNPRDYWKASYESIPESQVPLPLRYPVMFHGQGIRGHRYHVFDRPRYFVH